MERFHLKKHITQHENHHFHKLYPLFLKLWKYTYRDRGQKTNKQTNKKNQKKTCCTTLYVNYFELNLFKLKLKLQQHIKTGSNIWIMIVHFWSIRVFFFLQYNNYFLLLFLPMKHMLCLFGFWCVSFFICYIKHGSQSLILLSTWIFITSCH